MLDREDGVENSQAKIVVLANVRIRLWPLRRDEGRRSDGPAHVFIYFLFIY